MNGRVRRRVGPHTPFVHELLRYLEERGFGGAPRVVGIKDDEEIITFLDGHVPVETAPDTIRSIVLSDEGVGSAFSLIRRYHDITAGSVLAGRDEIVCHGDLSQWNTVYDESGAIGFVDWDNAAPGARHHDVGYAVWRYLMLGFPKAPAIAVQARQLGIVAQAYGMWDRPALLDHAAAAQRFQRAAFERKQADGDARFLRLIELGALNHIDGAQRWLQEHRLDLLG